MNDNLHWVGSWATAPAPAETGAFNNQTLRMTMRASLGGNQLRVRVSNAYGRRPLDIGGAHIALREAGAAIVAGSDRKLNFGGAAEATIAAGAVLFSDPVGLDLPPLADLAVSLYLPGEILNDFQITGRYARQTSYVSPPGDFSAAKVMPIASLTSDWFFVCGLDVLASADTGGIIALGDSLTDGNISTMDAFCRWPDQLARRLAARHRGRPMAVMNQGLGGNRILYDIRGDSGLRRFDRDVLAQPGVTHVIVMLGTNDLRNRWKKPEEEPTAAQMIAGLRQMAVRAHARGIKIIGATLTPFGNETYMAGAWNPQREEVRRAVNGWIRDGGAFDAVADFDQALRDPEQPTQMRASDDCGDGLHPSDLG
ncbi:MAG: SGNH/GDSL hydrolase family protein, partial [Stellaceae bacterium]